MSSFRKNDCESGQHAYGKRADQESVDEASHTDLKNKWFLDRKKRKDM